MVFIDPEGKNKKRLKSKFSRKMPISAESV